MDGKGGEKGCVMAVGGWSPMGLVSLTALPRSG